MYLCFVKLTLKIKLLPDKKQEKSLIKTIKEFNSACNEISNIAWNNNTFNTYKLHYLTYHKIKSSFKLSAQLVVRSIAKVSDSYKLDKKVEREFRLKGAVTYDSRILSYSKNIASLSTIDGRIKVQFVCHRPDWLPYIKGEADLICRKGKYFLFQTVEFPDKKIKDVEEFLGVDFGQTDIAVLSDGANFNSRQLKEVRKKYSKVRASVQSKGTKSSRRLLKRLSGKERRFVSINNHTIAKQIVAKAKTENKGVAIEDLSSIRKTAKPKSRVQKTELNRWSFFQLRQFLTYKSVLSGVKLVVVPPAYTSQTCNSCLHIGERNAKHFRCKNCGNTSDADHNAALNIAAWGHTIVKCPESSTMFCSLHS